MNNQQLTSIALKKSSRKRERFNMSHDVNTTADFGAIQPLMCRCVPANTKNVLNTRSLTRLAPMVAPAFGRVKFKIWHEFVSCSDICKTFDSIMSQQPIYKAGVNRNEVSTTAPYCELRQLSALVLSGARLTIYEDVNSATSSLSDPTRTFKSYSNLDTSDVTKLGTAVGFLSGNSGINMARNASDSITENALNIVHWHFGNGNLGFSSSVFQIPLANDDSTFGTNYDFGFHYDTSGNLDNSPVYLESADLVFEIENTATNGKKYALAFRLSDFGKRLRKIFIGCGYQIDLRSTTKVSLLPIFAFYKSYWNLFGLTQWQNYETTSLAALVDYMLNWSISNVPFYMYQPNVGANLVSIFGKFINDLGQCFYNDSADFVSAHLPSTAVSPALPSNFEFIDVISGQDNVNEVDSQGTPDGVPYSLSSNGHSFINQLEHGYLDEEYLKKLYRWTNKNTIVGRKIREVMRAQGLGKYMDSTKTDFIGYTDDVVTISDVVSTADTDFGSGSGKLLGEYGGRGLQLTQSKTFTYENEEFGFLVTLCAIVPECGYMQQLDKSVTAITKFQFPNADFDSMGFEADRKQVVQGASDWSNTADGSLDSTFGYVPRYFGWKFKTNINNGDVTLRSERDTYLPYTLDKFIPVNDRRCVRDSSIDRQCVVTRGLDAQSLPDSLFINLYRSVGKYAWFGNYNRIFANNSDLVRTDGFEEWSGDNWSISLFPYFVRTDENFLIHNIIDYTQYAPLLAVEDSFETHDEDEKPDMSIKKA